MIGLARLLNPSSPNILRVIENTAMELSGQIEIITYTNEKTGYLVAKVKVAGMKKPVTVVGNLLSPALGETFTMKGEWIKHPKFGDQFAVSEFVSIVPEDALGVEKYLGSGMIKGLGPVMAKRIVKKFGEKALSVIENETEKLTEIEGIGKKRIAEIKKAWDEQKSIRSIMLFLYAHGIGSGYAIKIYRKYGDRAVAVLKENPYRLVSDIFGIGFLTADKIAQKFGFLKDSDERIAAGIFYVLSELANDGHVYYPYKLLVEKCAEILDVDRDSIKNKIDDLSLSGKIVIEEIEDKQEDKQSKGVFLLRYHYCETGIANCLKLIADSAGPFKITVSDKAIEWVQKSMAIKLAQKQIEAIKSALYSKVMVITGGPGTGKTTIVNAILKISQSLKLKTLLAAPTGRAAKRMSEATAHEAKTIHRMLEFNFEQGGFQKDENNPLDCDLLIIDEASMIDTILMFGLLKAVPSGTALILVGDVNQLPSVGAGNVLNDIISSGLFSVVVLSEIFRQAKKSRIVINAHRINSGQMPFLKTEDNESDYYFIEQNEPERAVEIIRELVAHRIPKRFGFDPFSDIQVLSPMHKGELGVSNLNMILQEALNPGDALYSSQERNYKIGDKVMQIKNNYDKDVYNGDIGRITSIDSKEQNVMVSFDNRLVKYDFNEIDEIILSYAVSVHKSQGSEYPAVVIPVHTQHYMLLQRNLIYTALTRGRRLVVMVGAKKALAIGINNSKTQKRYTYLKNRLSMTSTLL